jgi:hypothetical protein
MMPAPKDGWVAKTQPKAKKASKSTKAPKAVSEPLMIEVERDEVVDLASSIYGLAVTEGVSGPVACASFMLAYLVASTQDLEYSLKVLSDASKAAQQIVVFHRDVKGTVQ